MEEHETVRIGFGDGRGAAGVAIEGAGWLVAHGGSVAAHEGFELEDAAGTACTVRGAGGCELTLEPLGPPADLGAAARMWLCRARGSAAGHPFEGLGTIMRSRGADGAVLERAVIATFGPASAVALAARRPRRARGHGEERLDAAILRGDPLAPVLVADPRLSSTYDGQGRLVRCGIELWETEESEYALRIGGRAHAHGELRHGDGARTRVSFVEFRDGEAPGAGRYEITER